MKDGADKQNSKLESTPYSLDYKHIKQHTVQKTERKKNETAVNLRLFYLITLLTDIVRRPCCVSAPTLP